MTRICKYCQKVIVWDISKNAYFEANGKQHECQSYFQARKLKDSINAKHGDDLLLQILNELMAIRTILGERKNGN